VSRTSAPAPLDDRRMWRRVAALVHPDAGGDHEAFLFVTAVRETLEALPSRCSCNPLAGQHNRRHAGQSAYIREAPYTADATARVPFSAPVNHGALLDLAVREGKRRTDEIGALLTMLASYKQNTSGRHQPAEQRGSTFKQLKYLSILAGVDAKACMSAQKNSCCHKLAWLTSSTP
jgi:hypothetical protein